MLLRDPFVTGRRYDAASAAVPWDSQTSIAETSVALTISVIVCAFNEERSLPGCLYSVLAQTHPPDQIIVVNNASTDQTRAVALQVPGVTVVDEPRKGLVVAREAGRRAASGQILVFLDADCRAPLMWLASIGCALEAHAEAVALTGPYRFYDWDLWGRLLLRAYDWTVAPATHLLAQRVLRIGAILYGGNFAVRREATTRRIEVSTCYLWDHRRDLSDLVDVWEAANRDDLFSVTSLKHFPYVANSDFHKPKHLYSWKTLLRCEKRWPAIRQALIDNVDIALTLFRSEAWTAQTQRPGHDCARRPQPLHVLLPLLQLCVRHSVHAPQSGDRHTFSHVASR
jgi:glycosyltransferase involved in cell wall biosynthesis